MRTEGIISWWTFSQQFSWPLPSARAILLLRRDEGYADHGLEGDVYIMYVPEKSLIEVARGDGENIDRLILPKYRLLFLALLSSSHNTNIHTYVHIRKYIYCSMYIYNSRGSE